MFFNTRVVAGLDAGRHSVKVAVLAQNRREILDLIEEPVLPERHALEETADTQALGAAIQRALAPWTARPRTTCTLTVAVQGEGPVGTLVTLPALKKEQVEIALEAATVRMLPYPRTEAAVGVVPAPTAPGSGSSWFITAVRKEALGRLEECLRGCGATATKMEVHVLPMVRTFMANYASSGELEGLINVGSRMTTMVAVQGGAPVALRCFRIGGDDFTYAHHMTLQGSWQEAEAHKVASDAMAREVAVEPPLTRWLDQVRKSVQTWARSDGPGCPSRFTLTGGGAAWKGLAPRVAELLDLPVRVAGWERLVPPQPRAQAPAGAFDIAVGLCLP